MASAEDDASQLIAGRAYDPAQVKPKKFDFSPFVSDSKKRRQDKEPEVAQLPKRLCITAFSEKFSSRLGGNNIGQVKHMVRAFRQGFQVSAMPNGNPEQLLVIHKLLLICCMMLTCAAKL